MHIEQAHCPRCANDVSAGIKTFTDEAQTALFKDPVCTAL